MAENKQALIFFGLVIAAIIAANTPSCNKPGTKPSSQQQASQICDEVYADKDDPLGYSECIESTSRMLKNN